MIKSGSLSTAVATALTETPAPGSVCPVVDGMEGSVFVARNSAPLEVQRVNKRKANEQEKEKEEKKTFLWHGWRERCEHS